MRRLKELWFWWRESARRRRIIGLGLFILICGGYSAVSSLHQRLPMLMRHH